MPVAEARLLECETLEDAERYHRVFDAGFGPED